MMDAKITADDIRAALIKKYAAPEYELCFEVGNSTGAQAIRHADAVVVSTYPSRGYEVIGFEIKVSKSDLRHELNSPAKADAVHRFCHKWFLVTPKGLCDGEDIPHAWGVMELKNNGLHVKKTSPSNEPDKLTYGFLSAMLRGKNRMLNTSLQDRLKQEYERGKQDQFYANGRAVDNLNNLIEKLKEVKDKTGIDLLGWHPAQSVIDDLKNVNVIRNVARRYRGLKADVEFLTSRLTALGEAMKNIEGENYDE